MEDFVACPNYFEAAEVGCLDAVKNIWKNHIENFRIIIFQHCMHDVQMDSTSFVTAEFSAGEFVVRLIPGQCFRKQKGFEITRRGEDSSPGGNTPPRL